MNGDAEKIIIFKLECEWYSCRIEETIRKRVVEKKWKTANHGAQIKF